MKLPVTLLATVLSLVLFALPLSAATTTAQNAPETKQAMLAALDFLELCDREDYAGGWAQTAQIFRQKTDQESWLQEITHLRSQYEENLGRTLQLSKPVTAEQEGQELLFLIFRSRFARKSTAEMVTLSKEPTQPWRVAGYSIQ